MPKRVTRSSTRTLESSSSSGGGLVIKISKKKQETTAAAGAGGGGSGGDKGHAPSTGAETEGKGRKKGTGEGGKRRKVRPLTEEEKALQRAYRTLRAARAASEAAQKERSATRALGETEANALGGNSGSGVGGGPGGGAGAVAALERARSLVGSVAGMATLLRSSGTAAEELDEAARSALARQLQQEREREPQSSGSDAAASVAKRAEESDSAGAALGRAAHRAAAARRQLQTAAREAREEGEDDDREMPEAGEQAMPYGHPAQAQAGYSTHTVFVGDISPNVMAHDLEDAFSCCGAVESVRVIPGKPFAFVQFTEAEFAQKALAEMNGASVCDCVIRVSPAKVQGSSGPPSSHWAPGPRGFAAPGRNFWEPTMGHMNAYAPVHPGPPPAQVAPQLREHLEQQQLYGHLGPADADMDRGLVSYEDI